MGFIKLPSNSEKVLLDLVQSENPTQTLCSLYEKASNQTENELDGIVEELIECGYIKVKWADDMPWIVILSNSARTYCEQLSEHETQKETQKSHETDLKSVVFISHRSSDKNIADMLVDFFSGTGIPKNAVFCSSLPGNDINEKISGEVKDALKASAVNIAILSQDYYQSAYCLNEAGVLWYEDVPVIPIAMPEINSSNMYGFLNNEYKLRRLDCDTDISYIYDTVSDALSASHIRASIITHENNKLRAKYAEYLKTREIQLLPVAHTNTFSVDNITTDDERIVLYYILDKKIRKVSKTVIENWLNEHEIYGVNVDNAFDLLSSFEGIIISNDTLEFSIEFFRKYSVKADSILADLKACVELHRKLAVNTFTTIWNSDTLDTAMSLFIAYIVDEKIRAFGDRWMAKGQIESIRQWENKFSLDPILSSNYGSCLEFFVQNNLVYASSRTNYGNPREYTLCPSLQKFLFNCPADISIELQKLKDVDYYNLPF